MHPLTAHETFTTKHTRRGSHAQLSAGKSPYLLSTPASANLEGIFSRSSSSSRRPIPAPGGEGGGGDLVWAGSSAPGGDGGGEGGGGDGGGDGGGGEGGGGEGGALGEPEGGGDGGGGDGAGDGGGPGGGGEGGGGVTWHALPSLHPAPPHLYAPPPTTVEGAHVPLEK